MFLLKRATLVFLVEAEKGLVAEVGGLASSMETNSPSKSSLMSSSAYEMALDESLCRNECPDLSVCPAAKEALEEECLKDFEAESGCPS